MSRKRIAYVAHGSRRLDYARKNGARNRDKRGEMERLPERPNTKTRVWIQGTGDIPSHDAFRNELLLCFFCKKSECWKRCTVNEFFQV